MSCIRITKKRLFSLYCIALLHDSFLNCIKACFFFIVVVVLNWQGQENELLLMSVLDCLYNAISQILRKNVDKKSLFDNLEVGLTVY